MWKAKISALPTPERNPKQKCIIKCIFTVGQNRIIFLQNTSAKLVRDIQKIDIGLFELTLKLWVTEIVDNGADEEEK